MKKIFISYSHKDAVYKEKLVKQLDILKLAGLCGAWDDSLIQTGKDWNLEIKKAIDEADVAVLMVSEGFLNSKFITE
ncbi:MAG TPA: toll/interleukin-1 receptor domain-containing protein, partial [Candidatus Deferrimicrobium sp.]|nr:toll/interleukin-1 receptor domain-containing protein [Candidatus Deferrimicrobium sp.]